MSPGSGYRNWFVSLRETDMQLSLQGNILNRTSCSKMELITILSAALLSPLDTGQIVFLNNFFFLISGIRGWSYLHFLYQIT